MADKIYENNASAYPGCDFAVRLGEDRRGTKIKLLQITDMQFIDAAQKRTPERLRRDEDTVWATENFMATCGSHIASLITQSNPDLIFITGDIIYGSFDDKGTTLKWFCDFMDSYKIPWAPVFGNHDNESKMGVAWQCELFEKSEFCLFRRGSVTGNGNYTVGITVGGELVRVLHMTDSNGCWDSDDKNVERNKGIYPDQLDLIRENTRKIREAQGKDIPAFMAFHIPTDTFLTAETEKGYKTEDRQLYTLGVDVPALDGDYGFCLEPYFPIKTDGTFLPFLKENGIDGVFVGHAHNICTAISYEGIKFVFGLKTGLYDYHVPGNVGGTLVTLEGDSFSVTHLPALAPFSPLPGGAKFLSNVLIYP